MSVVIKKGAGIFILLFLLVSLVSASLTFTKTPESDYILGEEVDVEASISLDHEGLKLVDFYLNCTDTELGFYRELLNPPLYDYILDLPAIVVQEDYLGGCFINAYLSDTYGNLVETWETDSFNVSSTLSLTFSTDKETYLPGEDVTVSGSVDSSGDVDLYAELKDGGVLINNLNQNFSSGLFAFSFKLNNDISRGDKHILVEVKDEYGNEAWTSKKIEVLQIARSMALELDKYEVNPAENITFTANVYDQTNEPMTLSVVYNISDPEKNPVDFFIQDSGEDIMLEIEEHAFPGEYTVQVSSTGFIDIKTFLVLELKKVNIDVRDGFVYAKNIGNVDYIEEVFVNASSEGVVYTIPVSLDLVPGEEVEIDIASELPSKNYQVAFYSENESYFIDDVFVEDNRPFTKKVSQGISRITGAAVIDTGRTSNFFYMVIIILVLCFLLVVVINKVLKGDFKGNFKGVFGKMTKFSERGVGGLKKVFRRRNRF